MANTDYSPEGSRLKFNLSTGESSISDYADLDRDEVFASDTVDFEDAPYSTDIAGIPHNAEYDRKMNNPKRGDILRGARFVYEYDTHPNPSGWRIRQIAPE